VPQADEDEEFAMAAATSAALFPTNDDFKLFFVRMAEPGKEREAVIQLSHKAAEEMRDGKGCQIRSIFSIDSLRGYIYVEAPNDTVAKNFLMGIRKVQWYNLTVVPRSEMASVFRAAIEDSNEKFRQLQPGEFVRVKKHPLYKGDLGRVIECYDRDVEIALVPRMDWFNSGLARPSQSLFDDRVVESLGVGEVERLRNPSTGEVRNHYKNEVFSDDGFLVKRFSRQALVVGDDVIPKIAELRWFKRSNDGGNITGPKTSSTSPKKEQIDALVPVVDSQTITGPPTLIPKSTFAIGELVRVTSGDMKNLIGKIVLVEKSGVVSIEPTEDSGLPAIQVLLRDIEKYFKLSDHVEILSGGSAGDTGIITAITGGVCSILIDGELRDVKVNINSLRLSTKISKGEVSLGGFSLGQLVQLSKPVETTGLVVRISKSGNFAILGIDEKRYSATLADISAAKASRDVTAISRHGDGIKKGSVVKYFDEGNQVRSGTVKEIYRNSLFVKENEKIENSGFSVVDSRGVELVATSGRGKDSGPPQQQPQQHANGGIQYRKPGMSKLEGKRVRIIKGQFKGQLAQVREDHDTRVQVSLEAKFKVVTIPKDCVRLEDDMDDGVQESVSGNLNAPPAGMMGSLSAPPAGYVPPSSTPFTPAPPHLRGPH
jgi:transcription elongation factor SPT5